MDGGYSSAFYNMLLVIIDAAYARAATMLIEAIRPLIEKRRRKAGPSKS